MSSRADPAGPAVEADFLAATGQELDEQPVSDQLVVS